MLLAMLSVLTLLPKLILTIKPFGEEKYYLMISNFFEQLFDTINLFDIIFLIILIYCMIQCFLKGFSLSLILFMKWIFATIMTIILVPKFQPK